MSTALSALSAVAFTVTMAMQSHANDEIYQRAVKILETYFGEEDDGEIDGIEGPIVGEGGGYEFGAQMQGGFTNFGGPQ